MTGAGQCPHPEKKRWPLRDDTEGLRCSCGHAWAPWQFTASANRYFNVEGHGSRLEVYRCRDRASGTLLDHWHTTDQGKREHVREGVDRVVKIGVVSSEDIRKPGWNRRRKGRPVTRSEWHRLRRHRVI